mgnify:CR=1 FL=1
MKATDIFFFDFSLLYELNIKNPELFLLFNYWLFRSTISIEAKKRIIKTANSKTKIIEAISILKNNYCISRISLRNQELLFHLKQRMDSS